MKRVENFLWISGFLLLTVYFVGRSWADSARVDAISEFVTRKHDIDARTQAPDPIAQRIVVSDASAPAATPATLPPFDPPIQATAVVEDARSAAQPTSTLVAADARPAAALHLDAAIAILRIPRLALEVPVATGTDARTLRRGAGLIAGSAAPGSIGNVSIAAHRDSFFRPLADVVVGDLIELESLSRVDSYRIAELSVVEPADVHVLAPTSEATLTLVTCFPFRFVGHAPQRFIVRAVATEFHPQPPRRKT